MKLVTGNSNIRGAARLKRFQDGVSWLAQIIMFLVLGVFATLLVFAFRDEEEIEISAEQIARFDRRHQAEFVR